VDGASILELGLVDICPIRKTYLADERDQSMKKWIAYIGAKLIHSEVTVPTSTRRTTIAVASKILDKAEVWLGSALTKGSVRF
jgi:hypothetical protein